MGPKKVDEVKELRVCLNGHVEFVTDWAEQSKWTCKLKSYYGLQMLLLFAYGGQNGTQW